MKNNTLTKYLKFFFLAYGIAAFLLVPLLFLSNAFGIGSMFSLIGTVKEHSLYQPTNRDIMEGIMSGVAQVVNDPYTEYYNQHQWEEISKQLDSIPSVETAELQEYKDLGYIRINQFTEESVQEMTEALASMKDKQGLVLDLRDNPGLTPKGFNIHNVGIEPDYIIKNPGVGEKDQQLLKAIAILEQARR